MKAVVQLLGSGETNLVDLPAPQALPGTVVIASRRSLISSGTERTAVTMGRRSMVGRALQRPDKVRLVLDKIRTDGLMTALDAIRSKLDQPVTLGYSNAGVVVEVGPGVTEFKPGDRVVSNGTHAEIIRVPVTLCARIPDGVDDDAACFAVVAAIGLQGVRLAEPTPGETVVVIGLGLIGLMAAQILLANGCHVLGLDLDEQRLALAKTLGVQTYDPSKAGDAVAAVMQFTNGRGAEAVVVAAATTSSELVAQAGGMCRKRGRIVLVGSTGLTLDRAGFHEKALSLRVSCSYGPGRYDANDEERSQDYPLGFIRWTAKQNFEAVLGLIEAGRIATARLVSHRIDFRNAISAYDILDESPSSLAIVLRYPEQPIEDVTMRRIAIAEHSSVYAPNEPVIGWIGAGNYSSRVLIPAFKAAGARFHTIATTGGAAGIHHGRSAGFVVASSDPADVFRNDAVNTVVIATRHDTHAQFVIDALAAGRHVFVEKPLALDLDDVERIEAAWRAAAEAGAPRQLMVGFNRRFAPLVRQIKELLAHVSEPAAFIYTFNAGPILPDHWLTGEEGGGRIVGEACHFVDLLRHLAGSPIVETQIIPFAYRRGTTTDDGAVISLRFENGSVGTIQHLANGSPRFPRERLEVFAGGGVIALDNFRTLRGYSWPGFTRARRWRQDKGQNACAAAFLAAVRDDSAPPIPIDEVFEVARVTLELGAAMRSTRGAPA